MLDTTTHYQTLEISPSASPAEIKSAYRRLAKTLHPDRNTSPSSHTAIAQLNAAYEILSDPLSRRSYDQQLHYIPVGAVPTREEREATVQEQFRQQRRRTEKNTDAQLQDWLKKVYTPGLRLINQIIKPLKSQITDLSADPFDDQLMGAFQTYLEDCRSHLDKAQKLFRSIPNPPAIASIAAHVYYCLNQLGDALDELEYFTQNYDETSLHTGYEMFRIANGLKQEVQAAVRELPK
jgi:molecular chaperone DnaJ